jgi:hypothetical protein
LELRGVLFNFEALKGLAMQKAGCHGGKAFELYYVRLHHPVKQKAG